VDDDEDEEESAAEQRPPTIGIPLRATRLAGSNHSDWIFPLPLTLEELHSGTSFRFQITRQVLSTPNQSCESFHLSSDSLPSSTVHVDVEIPPGGYKNGTQIRFEGIGNQRKSDGSFQDVVFVVQEIAHNRFARVQDDLVARIELVWDEGVLRDDVIFIEGLDGENVAIPIPASPDSDEETRITKAGMPVRNSDGRIIGRGDLVIKYGRFIYAPKFSWLYLY
jgi:DnaJ homolog subfamily B member 4